MGLISVKATRLEHAAPLPGDDIVARPDVTMDRAFTVDAAPSVVWPWIVQLGKQRAGWYFPRSVELFIPKKRRGSRTIDARFQDLGVGDVIPDYGGTGAYFEVAQIDAGRLLVYRSTRGNTNLSWAIRLTPSEGQKTRLHFRLILGPVKRKRLAEVAGGFFDYTTILGLAAGLQERVRRPG
ncbi:MAG: hypothetical protein M3Q98_10320 [Actinomycetota bacterium]|nr:hypothetical protein [Actinomycetota bacterium]